MYLIRISIYGPAHLIVHQTTLIMNGNTAPTSTSIDDQNRIEALNRYKIFGTPSEKSFDNIADLATDLFNVPIALVTFVDTENVFLKSNVGIEDIRLNPTNNSLCAMALLNEDVTVFNDISTIDPVLLSNPITAAELGFKFYAGAPLITYDGFSIGTICIMDKKTRAFNDRDKRLLQKIARIVMDEIELRLHSHK
jgi:GAF domain-containing protein